MLITNCTVATMADDQLGLIESAAVVVQAEKIAWVGAQADLPSAFQDYETLDLNGSLVTPGLVDCHTHLVYAGNRSKEFELRLNGASYEEIARAGGGIVSTVNAVRQASLEDLVNQSRPRLNQLMSEGVTTVEIKSGYGLDSGNEIKMLRAAQQLAADTRARVQRTFLGAHALPPEFSGRADAYIDLVCDEMLPRAVDAGVVDAVDAFVEGIAFTREQGERVFSKALELGLAIKIHAEQLSDLGGAIMAAQYGALSADHLEYLDPSQCSTLAQAGTVAVMLPGAFYFLHETQLPPIQALRDAGVHIAVATDCNPGSSPLCSPLLAMNMACTLFNLTPTESLRGMTINGARALGMSDMIGSIEAGKLADLAIWSTDNPADLSYHAGMNLCSNSMINGEWSHSPENH